MYFLIPGYAIALFLTGFVSELFAALRLTLEAWHPVR